MTTIIPSETPLHNQNISETTSNYRLYSDITSPKITVTPDCLKIDCFECRDPDIVSYFADIEIPQLDETLRNALKIGVAAYKVRGIVQPTEYIDRRFARIEVSLRDSVDEAIEALQRDVEEKFGKEGEVGKKLEELFGKDGAVTELLDSSNQHSPLHIMKEEIRSSIVDLTTAIGRQQGNNQMKNKSPAKGFDFEDHIDRTLGHILATTKGDEYHSVSTQIGRVRNSKKGDRVVVLSESKNLRIAIEPKDVSKISLHEIHRMAKESLTNRDCQYAIIIIKHANALPAGVGLINEYGDHLVLALTSGEGELDLYIHNELLAMAYRLARIRVIEMTKKSVGLDGRALSDHLRKINESLSSLSKIDAHISNSRKDMDAIQQIERDVISGISSELDMIESLCKYSFEKMNLRSLNSNKNQAEVKEE